MPRRRPQLVRHGPNPTPIPGHIRDTSASRDGFGKPEKPCLQDASEADARNRTGDPFITSEVLYQLSYVGSRTESGILLLTHHQSGTAECETGWCVRE
jgi:hypothetical protein